MVYSYLFVSDHLVYPFPRRDRAEWTELCLGKHYAPFRLRLNVLLACHQIHDEASRILYGKNTFFFHRFNYTDLCRPSQVRRLMESIGPRYRELVRNVDFYGGWWGGITLGDDARTRTKIAFAILLTCFRLRMLTVSFDHLKVGVSHRKHVSRRHTFTIIDHGSTTTGRKHLLQQVNLELDACSKALEACLAI